MSLTLNRPDNGNLGAAQPLDGWSATGTSRGAAAIPVGTGSAPLSPRPPESHTADSQFNSDVTCAQQALGFLDTAAVNLQSLKVAVSAKLGGRNIDQGQLEARLEQFTRQWADRRRLLPAWMRS
ncbi:hypothetical protein [Paludibacterium denitrificans]|uniref:Uncharacterized protein n=1 Tax=Paludibacterium denitrificans TaxID=2675226 RepID=A0A844G974_9NEIS|nr:hypothetical protein [Paludibacterium denitrificans]MTD32903.1 hypothetical protein [Paludibacterium denitrificans]